MKKRHLVPVVAVGGAALYIATLFTSLDLGNLGIPTGAEALIQKPDDSSLDAPLTAADLAATAEPVPEPPPRKLLLVDVLINGDRYFAERSFDTEEAIERDPRREVTVEEIIQTVRQAEGDVSGTRIRITRTPEAIASAESRLLGSLNDAGISSDVIDSRRRLAE